MALDPDNLMSLKVTELRAELKKRGLPATGLKQALVDRLREDLVKEEPEVEEEEEEDAEGEDEEKEAAPEEAKEVEQEVTPEETKEATPEVATPEVAVEATPEVVEEATQEVAAPEITTPEVVEEATQEVAAPEITTPEVAEEATPEEAQKEVEQDATPAQETHAVDETHAAEETPAAEPQQQQQEQETQQETSQATDDVTMDDAPVAKLEKVEEQQVPEAALPTPPEQDTPAPVDVKEEEEEAKKEVTEAKDEPAEGVKQDVKEELKEAEPEQLPAAPSDKPTLISTEPARETVLTADQIPPIPAPDAMEVDPIDILKRKRRSGSPVPGTVSPTTKKARADTGPIPPRNRDARFKGLFNDTAPAPEADREAEDDDEAPIEPAMHPATRAVYISNLIRPLQEHALKSHVLALACRDQEPEEGLIETFFLDSVKSHALIVFSNLTAANRVRVGIHNKIFPSEKHRKPLWADFVPEESVLGWIEREQSRGMSTRWEVIYEKVGEEVVAELAELGAAGKAVRGRLADRIGSFDAGAGAGRNRGSIDLLNAPTGPRRGSDAPAEATHKPTEKRGPIVMNLDQLFRSTTTKPKLYYLPVDEKIALERLAKQGRDAKGRI
ncbi:hypothetical protein FPQ18DRAFT_145446 [Pyronema domesticum]|uniref:Similar to Myocardin acc. no. Q8VIM5 n=1 Tax=Pyronema omphalodes (strain CBS 100304) TaxID=1076935 RepID=U4L669_PYROM|nr:hypothetical protein FPQ18DRAFT_145446 [Pyronema domesticum]CCX12860.1 Similar to Myocardin; acc. no. Q8VIM5 [Pyronema omphalodes CBS 100304]